MATKLYVGKLPYATTEDQLREIFAAHGKILSVAIIKDRDTQQSKGFGFVEMESDDEAQAAIKALDGTEVGGRNILVNVARPPESRPSNGGFSGHGASHGGFQKRY